MVNRLLDYLEIKTKITSLFAFLMTIGILLYKRQSIDWISTLVFFIAMFIFDLATTAINNYIDTKTNDQQLQFKRKTALMIIFILIGISALLGLYLVYLTDILILFVGALCFLCGILYTYGPIPISRLPFGEIISGVFYGLFIPLLLIYINTSQDTLVTYGITGGILSLDINIINILFLLLFSIPLVCGTANIMLANNICDLEKDIQVKRFTLPFYLKEKSVYLFAGIYYLAYIAVIVMVLVKILSPLCLLMILTIIPVQKNIQVFFKKQDKRTTFIVAIKNYLLILGSITALIYISIIIDRFI